MKAFIENNKKLIIFLLIGILLLIFSSLFSRSLPDGGSNLHKEFKQVLEGIDGVGEISIMLNKSANNQPEGIVIVAQHGDAPAIKKILTDAASAALGIPSHKVQVFKLRKGQ